MTTAPGVSAPRTLTRTLRVEVCFPRARKTDLLGRAGAKEGDPDARGLWHELWDAQADLTRGCNDALTALYALRRGAVEWPQEPPARNPEGEVRPVPERTLVYRALSGLWHPWGKPLYAPRGRRLSGNAIVDAAGVVYTRLTSDWVKLLRGEQTLPTFRRVPIGVQNQGVELLPCGDVLLRVWGGRGHAPVRVRPVRLDPSRRAILRRIIDPDEPDWTHGNARLAWEQPTGRQGKWFLLLSWTGPVNEARSPRPLVGAVHLGMTTTASLAYADAETGAVLNEKDLVQLPESVVRGWKRLDAERRERLQSNRQDGGLREGRGRGRKLRVDPLGDKIQRMSDTAVEQVCAHIIRAAKRRGAVIVGIEDLSWSTGRALDALPDATNRERAAHRRWYFSWLQGAIRARLKIALEQEGMTAVEYSARDVSNTCPACGTVHPAPQRKRPRQRAEHPTAGRVQWHRFKCSCGFEAHVDRVAPVNGVQRALSVWRQARVAG